MRSRAVLRPCLALLVLVSPAAAQTAPMRSPAGDADLQAGVEAQPDREPAFRPLRVAKWTTLAAAAGFAVYGFARSDHADDTYRALERTCNRQPARCAARAPGGAYLDADMEAAFQDVLAANRRARTALVLSQVGVAASLVFFLLDLRNDRPPDDIPYVPRGLLLERDRDRVAVGVRIPLGPATAR